jgi:hypothetical protein
MAPPRGTGGEVPGAADATPVITRSIEAVREMTAVIRRPRNFVAVRIRSSSPGLFAVTSGPDSVPTGR